MASRGINKVILVGNLGSDPENRMSQAGAAITNLSIATSETWKDKSTGQQQERTEWHRVVFFNRLAEVAAEYLRKGSKVYVEGTLRTRKWQDKQTGQDRYTQKLWVMKCRCSIAAVPAVVVAIATTIKVAAAVFSLRQAPKQHPKRVALLIP